MEVGKKRIAYSESRDLPSHIINFYVQKTEPNERKRKYYEQKIKLWQPLLITLRKHLPPKNIQEK